MKQIFTTFLLLAVALCGSAQSTYNAASYAAIGDTVYLTSAQPDTANYYSSGAAYTWNFAGLKALTQQRLVFSNPKSTGFTQLQWAYIYNTANVNLASSNGQAVALGPFEETNNNDYYLKSSSMLAEKASSFSVSYNSVTISVKNTYTTADTLYKFPLQYADTFASYASYSTSLPGVYYTMQTLQRTNKADGWGTVITPYGTFNHCIRLVSDVVQADTFAFYGAGVPQITTAYRELKWLDSTKNYPVLYVKQTLTGGTYLTTQVQYYDKQQYFQPQALFAYVPLLPVVNDTVTFQNLSTNATAYKWNFGDGGTSLLANPQHIFTAAGTYNVTLIAYNGTLADTIALNVRVNSTLAVTLLSFTADREKTDNMLQWSTATENNTAYFAVEKGATPGSFTTIATVTAAGNSNTLRNYSYNDAGSGTGNVYYRLKIVDKDGQLTYSNTILLQNNIAPTVAVSMYPNPVTRNGNATVVINAAAGTTATVTVYNARGKAVAGNIINLSAGLNKCVLPLGGLAQGTYFLVCRTENYGVTGRLGFIIVQ